jgi:hypothetical protein
LCMVSYRNGDGQVALTCNKDIEKSG